MAARREGPSALAPVPLPGAVEQRLLHLRREPAGGAAHHQRLGQRQADRPEGQLHRGVRLVPHQRWRQLPHPRQGIQAGRHRQGRSGHLGGLDQGSGQAHPVLRPSRCVGLRQTRERHRILVHLRSDRREGHRPRHPGSHLQGRPDEHQARRPHLPGCERQGLGHLRRQGRCRYRHDRLLQDLAEVRNARRLLHRRGVWHRHPGGGDHHQGRRLNARAKCHGGHPEQQSQPERRRHPGGRRDARCNRCNCDAQ